MQYCYCLREVVVGDLQVMLPRHGLAVADPRTDDVGRVRWRPDKQPRQCTFDQLTAGGGRAADLLEADSLRRKRARRVPPKDTLMRYAAAANLLRAPFLR